VSFFLKTEAPTPKAFEKSAAKAVIRIEPR
jgi:hypothetical protein